MCIRDRLWHLQAAHTPDEALTAGADEFTRYYTWRNRKQQLEMLEDLRNYAADSATLNEICLLYTSRCV